MRYGKIRNIDPTQVCTTLHRRLVSETNALSARPNYPSDHLDDEFANRYYNLLTAHLNLINLALYFYSNAISVMLFTLFSDPYVLQLTNNLPGGHIVVWEKDVGVLYPLVCYGRSGTSFQKKAKCMFCTMKEKIKF
jgi:hypothetical protein